MTTDIAVINELERELALADDVPAISKVRDKAEALRTLARKVGASLALQNQYAIVKINAERKGGALLEDLATKGLRHARRGARPRDTMSLVETGIAETPDLARARSKRWQRAKQVDEHVCKAYYAHCQTEDEEITTAGLMRFWGRREHEDVQLDPPEGTYRTVVIDPPWPVAKIEREARPNQAKRLDYPTMTLEELADPQYCPAAEDGAHVYLWTTQKYIPAALELFEAWGVRYECLMTWVKPTGMTPYSWMYNTEHVLFGRVGDLALNELGIKLSFSAGVVGHSVKPDVFYDIVRRASPEPRIDMFARAQHEGFEGWGNESGMAAG